jgi:hypothetical protein
MTQSPLCEVDREEIVRRCWYSHDGAGLPLADEPPGLRCAKATGGACHRTLHLR